MNSNDFIEIYLVGNSIVAMINPNSLEVSVP